MYEDLHKDKDNCNLSQYPKNSKFYDKRNKKVTRKVKDEIKGVPIFEFVALMPKMYSYIIKNEKGDQKGKRN